MMVRGLIGFNCLIIHLLVVDNMTLAVRFASAKTT
jgi:hypothetical protein